jgi:hypothetical protein
MWKLLSDRDRKQVRKDKKAAAAGPTPEMGSLTILTTPGIGAYSCGACARYGRESDDASIPGNCSARGIPPDAMPCSMDPKDSWFTPVTRPLTVTKALFTLDLQDALILAAVLPQRIDELLLQAELKLPYRVGEQVSFIHEQTLMTAEITGFDATFVHVTVGDAELLLPHPSVLPAKRTAPTKPMPAPVQDPAQDRLTDQEPMV